MFELLRNRNRKSKKIMFGAQWFLPFGLKFYQNFPLYAENSRCRFYTVEF